jgi:predicted enzyme related to lactoylglutathione lyase
MLNITEIAFTGYPVTDLARARAFYEGLLGLKPTTTFGHEDKAWIEYDLGSSTFAITNMSPEWTPSSCGPSIAFEVADFDAAIATLRAAGTKFMVEPIDNPGCRLAVVFDSEGNSVAIHKRRAPAQ